MFLYLWDFGRNVAVKCLCNLNFLLNGVFVSRGSTVPWREMEGWKLACTWQGFQHPRRVFFKDRSDYGRLMIEMFVFTRAVGKGLRAQVAGFIVLMMSSTSCCKTSGKQ